VPIALEKTGKEVGIDLGISTLMALSDGTQIPNMRVGQKAQSELRIAQRALSRCRKGSRRRKKVKKEVTRLHAKIKNTRSTYLHQVSTRLVKEYDLIAMENLNIKGLAKGFLAKQVNDASWGKLQNYIRYKAEGAGKRVVEVSPNYTSQICPGCGVIKPKSLSERVHNCDSCGLVMDRDHASAMVIYDRAVVGPGIDNVVSLGKRRFGNISLEISK
jgi:putative transposase